LLGWLAVPAKSTHDSGTYRFGDLLALARRSWLGQMERGLQGLGYADFRRSDAMVLRQLQRRPLSIGRLGATLGVTRQAARKVADGLERRGLAGTVRDTEDARQVNVVLTADGRAYADAITKVIERLNRDLSARVDREDLVRADVVLRAALRDDHARMLAEFLPPPPS
jgi:DNA-binding MarR family transcriptional regulator